MNPGFYVDESYYQAGRTVIDLVYTSGATGAIPSPLGAVNYGVTSVTRTGTGALTIVFDGQWFGLLNYSLPVHQASYSKSGACHGEIAGVTASTRTILVQLVDAAGDATDSTTGDIVHMTFEFQRYGN